MNPKASIVSFEGESFLQRLSVVGVWALAVLAVFAAGRGNPRVGAAPAQANVMTVVATGISVRALATSWSGSAPTLYITNASAPNRVFQLGSLLSRDNGLSLSIAGSGSTGSLGDGGAATSAQFALEEGSLVERSAVAVAMDGTIYIADTGNATIRSIAGPKSTEPGVIRSTAGRWAPRQNLVLTEPMGISVDRAGDLFIADRAAGVVDRLAADGQMEVVAHVTSPATIAVTPDGTRVFVASPETGAVFSITTETHDIKAIPSFPEPKTTDQISGAAAMESPGSNACSPSASGSTPQVCPAGLAVDAAGDLFVSDANSGRILRIDAKTSASSTVANGLNQTGALAMDASGNLYVAEQGANRIVAFAQVGTSQGSLSITPGSAAYGNEPSGGATAPQSFTVSNTSTTLTITGLNVPKTSAPADFTEQSNSCTTTLASNASCTLSVAFTPTTTGARSATLTVTDSNSADSASTALTGTGDDYQLQLASGQLSSVSVQAGAAATFNLQVVPDNVFSGTVTFVCPNNLPTNTTCTFSPPTANVTPGKPTPFTVTFQTTGIINPFKPSMFPQRIPPNIPRFPALLVMGALAMLASTAGGRRRFVPTTIGALVMVLVLLGCSKGRSQASIGATPAGTSTMAVTGNAQNASRALTITLNVVQE